MNSHGYRSWDVRVICDLTLAAATAAAVSNGDVYGISTAGDHSMRVPSALKNRCCEYGQNKWIMQLGHGSKGKMPAGGGVMAGIAAKVGQSYGYVNHITIT